MESETSPNGAAAQAVAALGSNPAADTHSFYSSHAAFVDSFGGFCTLLSCGIAGYQIMQHMRHYSQPQI